MEDRMEPQMNQAFSGNDQQQEMRMVDRGQSGRYTDYKSPVLAGMLSILPGMGQVYIGYYKHGFIYMLIYAIVITMMTGGGMDESGMAPLGGIFLAFFFFFNIIDAVRRAKMVNHVIDGAIQAELPEDFELPGIRGSVTMGIVLIVVGVLMFLHTMFGMSLTWIQDWWPVGMIGFGVFLIYKDVKNQEEAKNL